MDSSSQPSPDRLSQLTLGALAGMICFLSYLVVALKKDKQRLLADADISTRAFIRGSPVAKLPVTTSTGQMATLDQFCAEGRSLAIFFTAAGCAECSRLDPLLNAVSRKQEVTVIAVYGTSIPAAANLTAGPAVRQVRSSINSIVGIAKASGAPSVILADARCQISAAGSGATGSRLVLERLLQGSEAP